MSDAGNIGAAAIAQESYHYDDSSTPPTSPKHTQFLDLTNGEGGERQESYEEEDDEDMPTRVPPPNGNSNAHMGAPNALGKVVETGQEHTGRWTKEEHEAFLSALHMYGKEWKKVAAKVKTRTVVQTRTHAQKYFQKLQKVTEGGKDELSHVDMGVSESARKSSQKKKRIPSIASASKAPRQSSVQSAAQLISHLSAGNGALSQESSPSYSMPAPPITLTRPAITQPLQPPQISSGFPAIHGFSTTTEPSNAFSTAFASSGGFREVTAGVPATARTFSMKIVAPDHDAATQRGHFPEPSPAACGKRKLAEIAAARMLAGVAMSGIGRVQMRAAEVEDVDGTATPPPGEITQRIVELHQIPAPPLITNSAVSGGRKLAGLSLQIVNPDSLDVSYEQQRRSGGDSPVTPWEGQLEALVRYVFLASESFPQLVECV
jgi:SHAQKYF class myb-like DNA-binding protein